MPLIRNFSVHVEKGQHIAIVGPTGAGKTTLVNLLMRFYDIDSGQILLGGREVSQYSRASTRARFGMVLQDTWLFGGTIAENIAFGRPEATRDEIVRACDEAYCDHFIRTLPKGYDTVIGSDRITLSGGQKQLLTIARALLADRELLILDEATSNGRARRPDRRAGYAPRASGKAGLLQRNLSESVRNLTGILQKNPVRGTTRTGFCILRLYIRHPRNAPPYTKAPFTPAGLKGALQYDFMDAHTLPTCPRPDGISGCNPHTGV